MRSFAIAAAALAFATSASAVPGPAQGPYHLDADGKCRDRHGVHVIARLCHATPHPSCNPAKFKRCGHACIPLDEHCHVPA